MDIQTQGSAQRFSDGEILIKETRLRVAGREARSRLFERGTCFLIEISFGVDCCRSAVGKRFSRAAYLYDLLVDGEVTPCTMLDILEDINSANSMQALYK